MDGLACALPRLSLSLPPLPQPLPRPLPAGAAHQPRGELAGVQLRPGQRGPVHLHGGGAPADHVLAGRPHQTAEAAAGEGESVGAVCMRACACMCAGMQACIRTRTPKRGSSLQGPSRLPHLAVSRGRTCENEGVAGWGRPRGAQDDARTPRRLSRPGAHPPQSWGLCPQQLPGTQGRTATWLLPEGTLCPVRLGVVGGSCAPPWIRLWCGNRSSCPLCDPPGDSTGQFPSTLSIPHFTDLRKSRVTWVRFLPHFKKWAFGSGEWG